MSRVIKKAEQALIDSKKAFPLDECMAKISRRYGPSSVALSGPCQGSSLAKCVCQQLSDRWDKIGDRFAGDNKKVVRLAMKLAETLSLTDDSERCEQFLQEKMKLKKKAASEVTSYLRAYAMDDMMDQDIDQMADEVETEDEVSDLGDEGISEEPFGGEGEEEVIVEDEPTGDEEVDMGFPAEEGMPGEMGEPVGGEMVTIEVPREVAEQVLESIKSQIEGPAEGLEGAPDMGLEGPAEGLEGAPEGLEGAPAQEAGIPGEPAKMQDEGTQVVVSKELCQGCGAAMASEGHKTPEQFLEKSEGREEHEKHETPAFEKKEHELGLEKHDEHKHGHEEMTDKGEDKHEEHEKHEEHKEEGEDKAEKTALVTSLSPAAAPARTHGNPGDPIQGSRLVRDYCEHCGDPIRVSGNIGNNICNKCTSQAAERPAFGRQRGPQDIEDDPYMHMDVAKNNKQIKTAQADDSQVGGKPISNKEKQVEAPKPISEGNLDQEGYSANGKKFQDGSTIKNEEKFDAKTIDKSEVSGGSSSLMGKDESFPEGTPKVPAGSSPIKNEQLTGGDVATKGTVIATIKPEGILVTAPDGRKFLAKASIRRTTDAAASALQEAIKAVKFDGDAKKFAADALRACKKSSKAVSVSLSENGMKVSSPFETVIAASKVSNITENVIKEISKIEFDGDIMKYAEATLAILKKAKCVQEDGCCKTDTGKLEAERFTNDGDKKPEDGGVTSKGDGKKPDSEKGQHKIDTGKKEANEFTNDGKKEAEASAQKTVKEAADKKVEAPKPISEGNLDQEGYSANEKKFQDGKTIGNEEKFDAKEVKKTDVSAGDKSLMGNEEPAAKEGPKVPAGGPKIGNEELTGGDLSTKGTVIATNQGIASEVREARLKAASAYVADLLRNGEIAEKEYTETLEKYAQMPVQAILALASSTRVARERASSVVKANAEKIGTQKTAGIAFPIIQPSSNEKSLKDRLVENFKLTKDLNKLDNMQG